MDDHDYLNYKYRITPEDDAQISALIKEFNQNT